eukprot:CAMPEP_0172795370 /NCGR_PEP_ID=MMETSP1074-20121228/210452_1 /TAXON_ID=2916 /ORGANISM="Ceratium fusus, Strain PA161109" /LENGTH=123 /DNA_ID=CAMNT_0013632457 /DNA_START=245 /DNA_END=613 /DNA_ORIENTATION=-
MPTGLYSQSAPIPDLWQPTKAAPLRVASHCAPELALPEAQCVKATHDLFQNVFRPQGLATSTSSIAAEMDRLMLKSYDSFCSVFVVIVNQVPLESITRRCEPLFWQRHLLPPMCSKVVTLLVL